MDKVTLLTTFYNEIFSPSLKVVVLRINHLSCPPVVLIILGATNRAVEAWRCLAWVASHQAGQLTHTKQQQLRRR